MDLYLINGNFITVDKAHPRCSAVKISDGRIAGLYDGDDYKGALQPGDRVIDLQGKTVVPGFNESHIHLLNYGYSLTKVDCSTVGSIPEMIASAQAFIREKAFPSGEWVLGRGWNQVGLRENREITAQDLDMISQDHPIAFTRICEHITVANHKAMALCGINSDTPQPEGGHFDVDERGEPTGIFRESARYMIYEHIPNLDKAGIKQILESVTQIAAANGVTSVQSDDFETFSDKDYETVIQAYRELKADHRLSCRVYEQCLLPEIGRLKEFLGKGYRTGQGDEFFKIGPLKLLTDGSLGGRTAFLTAPYSDDPATSGIPVFTQEQLNELVRTAHCAGMQVLTHAIGDGAMAMCLDSFNYAMAQCPKADPRFGIVHVQITTPEIIRRFKEQDTIAYIEPICMNNDLHMAEDRVGERIKTSYDYRRFLDEGIRTAISSDCPVDSINPMKNIYVAVTRQDYQGYPAGGWQPDKRLTVMEALESFTLGSAYASFEDHLKGSITEGKLADLAVLSEDITAIPPDAIRHVQIDMTILDGKIVYQRPAQDQR